MSLAGDGSADDRKRYASILDAANRVPRDVELAVFGHTAPLTEEFIRTERGLREFVIRQLSDRATHLTLTHDEAAMGDKEYMDYIVKKFLQDEGPVQMFKDRFGMQERILDPAYTMQLLKKFKKDRAAIKMVFAETRIIADRLEFKDSFQIKQNKSELLGIIVDERLNGNVIELQQMKMAMVRYFLSEIHRREVTELREDEFTRLPQEQIEKWVEEYDLKDILADFDDGASGATDVSQWPHGRAGD
ncbi:MAG: hypothetical protein IID32_10350 [Planctomycetes bacterium]|nr:hypothetical protein [Planctomycetota bacterium]